MSHADINHAPSRDAEESIALARLESDREIGLGSIVESPDERGRCESCGRADASLAPEARPRLICVGCHCHVDEPQPSVWAKLAELACRRMAELGDDERDESAAALADALSAGGLDLDELAESIADALAQSRLGAGAGRLSPPSAIMQWARVDALAIMIARAAQLAPREAEAVGLAL